MENATATTPPFTVDELLAINLWIEMLQAQSETSTNTQQPLRRQAVSTLLHHRIRVNMPWHRRGGQRLRVPCHQPLARSRCHGHGTIPNVRSVSSN